MPEFTGETSSATEAEKPAEPTLLPEVTETAEIPTKTKLEQSKILLPETKEKAEAPFTEKMEEVKEATEDSKTSEVLSPVANIETVSNQKVPAVTPKRRRMANVLDVLETIKSSSTPPKKAAVTPETTVEASGSKAPEQDTEAEAGPSEPSKAKTLESEAEKITKPTFAEGTGVVTPEASKIRDYIFRHASGKKLTEKEEQEAQHYAQKLKYPKGALIFNGSGEEDFLYCLPDSKEISVCREISRSFGFPTLEDGLSVLSKNDLADSLAYNSLKVRQMKFLYFLLSSKFFVCLNLLTQTYFSLQGLILSNALRAQKDAEDEGCSIALSNLRSEVIELRNEGLEKDKILYSLINKIKEDEAAFKSQAEAQKREIEDLRKQLARAKEERVLEETKRELSDQWADHLEVTVDR